MTPTKHSNTTPQEYVISVFTENRVGVLGRITSIFTRRKINIESLKVSETPLKGISMFTINTVTTQETMDRIMCAIERIVEVLRADHYQAADLTTQQIALYKVSPDLFGTTAGDVCLREHNARVIEITPEYVVLECTGLSDEISALRDVLKGQEMLLQFSRSENIILHGKSAEEALSGLI